MKKLFLSFPLLAFMLMLDACSTKVDLYADYKDIPVIYGLLDTSKEINYIRINRAFSGSNDNPINAHEVALIADSSNYVGKLDARIIEFETGFGNQYRPTGRVFMLDTVTIHDKDSGDFYAPHQKVYFTDADFKVNTPSTKYKYRLVINKGNDSITSETDVVGGVDFRILNAQVSFDPDSDNSSRVTFVPADNAAFYDVKLAFNYSEIKNGNTVNKQVKWDLGTKGIDELGIDGKNYYVNYIENVLFTVLEKAIGGDTIGVERYFGEKPIDVIVTAGGDELFNYIQINALAGGISQSVPDYTNVNGGYGVFSSRVNLVKEVKLSSNAQRKLYAKSWGFKQN